MKLINSKTKLIAMIIAIVMASTFITACGSSYEGSGTKTTTTTTTISCTGQDLSTSSSNTVTLTQSGTSRTYSLTDFYFVYPSVGTFQCFAPGAGNNTWTGTVAKDSSVSLNNVSFRVGFVTQTTTATITFTTFSQTGNSITCSGTATMI
jgi:hypothetical protein